MLQHLRLLFNFQLSISCIRDLGPCAQCHGDGTSRNDHGHRVITSDDGEKADNEPVELQMALETDWQLALLTFLEVDVLAIVPSVNVVGDMSTTKVKMAT